MDASGSGKGKKSVYRAKVASGKMEKGKNNSITIDTLTWESLIGSECKAWW